MIGTDVRPRLLTMDEALARLGDISKATLYSWICRKKSPPAIKIGSRLFFDEAQLDAWIAARPRVGGAVAPVGAAA